MRIFFEAPQYKINKGPRRNPTEAGKKVICSFPLQAKTQKISSDARIRVGGISFHFIPPVGGDFRQSLRHQFEQGRLLPRILIRAPTYDHVSTSSQGCIKKESPIRQIQELVEQQVVVPASFTKAFTPTFL